MKEVTFRKWHRYVGVTLLPLILVQTITGFVLSIVDSFGFVERTIQQSPEGIAIRVIRKLPKFLTSQDDLMMTLHFTGGRSFGGILRTLTAIALIWVMFSGTYIFLSIASRQRKRK